MKYILIIILIILIIVTLISIKIYEKYSNIKLDIGNEITKYFYKLGLSILQKKDFNNDINYNEHFFFQSLPTHIKYEFDDIHNCLISQGINYENFSNIPDVTLWEIINDNRLIFWKCLKPLINKILDETFKKCDLIKKVEYPIIHFRCADTPFLKHSSYFFQYYPFFIEALEKSFKINNKRYDKIQIMYCNFHNSNDNQKKSCDIYSKSLQDFLKENNFDSEIICNSNIDDFATLFYSPVVISTSSSFSFMSGFFGNGVYISTELIDKKTCNLCNEIILHDYNLKHENVDDYNNTDVVVNLLKNKK
jgi:hypothetical protein